MADSSPARLSARPACRQRGASQRGG